MRLNLPLTGLAAVALLATLGGCVAYPYGYPAPVGYTAGPPIPASFDRSWDAALGAASDAGVLVSATDRAAGRISGSKAGAAVTIYLHNQADGSLKVEFQAPNSKETNPTLNDRWLAHYNRRMGR
jgi:hypothetical protein